MKAQWFSYVLTTAGQDEPNNESSGPAWRKSSDPDIKENE